MPDLNDLKSDYIEKPSISELINSLVCIEELGFGYSTMFAGSQFLPSKNSSRWLNGMIGSPSPKESEYLKLIVSRGADAIPFLVQHLDDKRSTKIEPVSGIMWTAWDDEYDYNRRTKTEVPRGVNRDSFTEKYRDNPRNHQITVGDLCFVALGQIVNRNFSATRYQPTLGLIISSPTYSNTLLNVIKKDYSGMTQDDHRQQLINDFVYPDWEFRRNGAVIRLAFYYPEIVDDLLIKQLRIPTFNLVHVADFVHNVLYRSQSPEKLTQQFHEYEANYGLAGKDGILLQLFDDLDTQIADEEGRLYSPLETKYNARNILVQLFGYKDTVLPQDKPYIDFWADTELARLLESLANNNMITSAVFQEVYHIFSSIEDNDTLALACIKVLQGNEYDDELIAYCKRRIGKNKYQDHNLKLSLKVLTEIKNSNA